MSLPKLYETIKVAAGTPYAANVELYYATNEELSRLAVAISLALEARGDEGLRKLHEIAVPKKKPRYEPGDLRSYVDDREPEEKRQKRDNVAIAAVWRAAFSTMAIEDVKAIAIAARSLVSGRRTDAEEPRSETAER